MEARVRGEQQVNINGMNTTGCMPVTRQELTIPGAMLALSSCQVGQEVTAMMVGVAAMGKRRQQ